MRWKKCVMTMILAGLGLSQLGEAALPERNELRFSDDGPEAVRLFTGERWQTERTPAGTILSRDLQISGLGYTHIITCGAKPVHACRVWLQAPAEWGGSVAQYSFQGPAAERLLHSGWRQSTEAGRNVMEFAPADAPEVVADAPFAMTCDLDTNICEIAVRLIPTEDERN